MMRSKHLGLSFFKLFFSIFLFFCVSQALAQSKSPVSINDLTASSPSWSLAIRIIVFMSFLSILPALLVTLTAFTRIIIVLSILRQAIGIPGVPGNQVLIGLGLILTLFVMRPVFESMTEQVVEPSLAGAMDGKQAFLKAGDLLRVFMEKQTRRQDLDVFYHISSLKPVAGAAIPMSVLVPAYLTSELKTAFEMGFLILLPFLVIDIIVSSVLMSMGMMMLSPMVISLPFKILFFVMVDGWTLVVSSLVGSFR